MTERYSADEIFEIAEQIERNGAAFYRRAAEITQSHTSRDFLRRLALMEDDHQHTFARIRAELLGGDGAEANMDPEGQALAFLQAIADGKVFDTSVDPSTLIRGDETMKELLTTAIQLEKDSLVFYMGLKEAMPRGWGQEHIERIIREEMKHVTLLSRQLAKETEDA